LNFASLFYFNIYFGFTPAATGNIAQSIRVEFFGNLHEFGAVGKTITLQELKNI
jgi:hypothetical protein